MVSNLRIFLTTNFFAASIFQLVIRSTATFCLQTFDCGILFASRSEIRIANSGHRRGFCFYFNDIWFDCLNSYWLSLSLCVFLSNFALWLSWCQIERTNQWLIMCLTWPKDQLIINCLDLDDVCSHLIWCYVQLIHWIDPFDFGRW